MTSKIRPYIDRVQNQLFYIYFRLAPRDARLLQASKIFGEITDYSAIVDDRAFPNVDEKDGGNITRQQLEELAGGYNLALRNTSLNDFAEWLTIETFGIIEDKIDKHCYDISAPDCFTEFIYNSGRPFFKKATKYYLVKLLNATTYQLEGDSILYIVTGDNFPALYSFVKDSRSPYLKARLIG